MLEFILGLFVKPVYATCPVCIITVGGGLFIAEKLGIDPLLISIWLSGFNTAIAFWMASKFKNRYLQSSVIWSFFLYVSSLAYLYFSKQIGSPKHMFLGIDKSILGMTIGLIIFFLSVLTNKFIRQKNHGKVLFYYQKVIIPVVFLIVTTLIFAILL